MENLKWQDVKEKINTYDFSMIHQRLTLIEKWKQTDAWNAIDQYRRFLYLQAKYSNQHALPPSKEIDEVWHAHILHTEDYTAFCQEIFGQYFHHRPELPTALSSVITDGFERTQSLHYQEFGDYLYQIRSRSAKKCLKDFLIKLSQPLKIVTRFVQC